MVRASVFLIFLFMVALIAGMVGCGGVKYNLTMAVAPASSGTATDLTNASPYTAGTPVAKKAVAAGGYRFVNWMAPAGTFANANAAQTTFTMPAQDVIVTATFVAIYDLTISSTAGGSVTTPGEGTFIYDPGTVVNLVATQDAGYHFVNWTGNVGAIADVNDATTSVTLNGDYYITAHFEFGPQCIPMVAAGYRYTVGLKSDGIVIAVGLNTSGQCNVDGWTNIVQVGADYHHTVGLKSDGTVVAVGDNDSGQCDVGNWTNIVQVSAGDDHTVGLKSDGTVVAVGDNDYGQCDVGNWTNIVQVSACNHHTVGLKSDGTVVAVGQNYYGQCDVGNWTNIVQVSAGGAGVMTHPGLPDKFTEHTVGLKSDGTVVAVGYDDSGQCDVSGWTGIVQVFAGGLHTVGLKSDGTVVAVGYDYYGQCDVGGWTDIVQVGADFHHTVGLKSDGTVVAVGSNYAGQCNVAGWDLK
jgi:alpha-tubulin suppressor-like RCC1 family protein